MSVTRRSFAAFAAALALSVSVAGPGVAQEPVKVVATTGMIADATRAVGGDLVDVRALMGPGVDPHAYRQTRSDIVAMSRADLVLWNGLFLEAQMEDVLADLSRRTRVVAVAEAIPQNRLLSHDDYEGRFDPHVWMDPALWSEVVRTVESALGAVRPADTEVFAENAAAYLSQIERLGAYSADVLSSVPSNARVLLTAHDAFNYFGASYGFEVLGIQGISTESEAGLNRIGALVDMLVDREIGAVFVESSVSDRNIRALIEGARARGHEVSIGGELYSDAMGAPGSYEGTYIGMIDHNVTTIAGSLGGDAPSRGMDGRLAAGM